jgi:uncharacterized protein YkwD
LFVVAGMASLPAIAGPAPKPDTNPELKVWINERGFTRGSFHYESSAPKKSRTVVIVRSDGVEIARRNKARQNGAWVDKSAPIGTVSYHARLIVDGVARPWGPWATITRSNPTTTQAPTTTIAPTTTTRPATTTTQAPTTTTTTPGGDFTGPFDCPPEYEATVLTLVNAERTQRGLPALPRDERLMVAAENSVRHNGTIALEAGRTGAQDRTPTHERDAEFIAAAGYPNWGGMNLGKGYFTPEAAVDGWMRSTLGHKDRILDVPNRAAGAGCVYIRTPWYGGYWDTYFWAFSFGW